MTRSLPAGLIVDSTPLRSFQSIKMVGINYLMCIEYVDVFNRNEYFIAYRSMYYKLMTENSLAFLDY